MPALIIVAAAAAMSQAAADECLPAPKGTAAKGQHWHYHLDHKTHQKCWYLRGAAPAADTQGAASAATPPATATAPRTAQSAAAPPAPPAVRPGPSAADNGVAASPPAPIAPDVQPPETSAASQSTGSIWTDPPSAAASAAPAADAANAPSSAADAQPASPQPSATQNQAAPVAAAEPKATAGTLTENLWIVALAAALAAFTFAALALVRARKSVKPTPAPAAPAGPRFGSGGVRRGSARWPIERKSETPALPAIEASLIPEQVPIPLPPLDTRR